MERGPKNISKCLATTNISTTNIKAHFVFAMPKENKIGRGRREEEKQKRKRGGDEDDTPKAKKQRSEDPAEQEDIQFFGTDNAEAAMGDGEEGGQERPFYGMLEDEEQEYFRRADELLELNDFPSEEERSLFLANVYREAEGKELKIACSQSCSRLMERLIMLSTVEQKKKLFEKFAGNFPHLVQHRFSSHCCETLFIQSAPIVTEELIADAKKKKKKQGDEDLGETEQTSMEALFLASLDEFEGQMTFLLTNRFASHTLRVLLVILSGRALEQASTTTMLHSKKKEKITITGYNSSPTELTLNKRAVPSSFQYAVEKIMTDTIATMDQSFIRILATHPTGNPTLQLLLEIELTNPNSKKGANSEQKTIISSLLPDDMTAEGSESATFINGLLYDPIGSRLLETICTYAPGKLFKQIYKGVFKDRIAAVARNEISSYVAIRVLNRISKEDLEEAVAAITPQLLGLVERNRTVIVKTLLERCHARGLDTTALTRAITVAYGDDPETLVLKMASIDDASALISSTVSVEESAEDAAPTKKSTRLPSSATASQLHGSLLAQSMLLIPGAASKLIQESLLAQPNDILIALAMYNTTTHIIQSALSPSIINTVPFRRKFINALLFPASLSTTSPTMQLALSSSGSHVLDALLSSTTAPTLLPQNTSSTTTSGSAPLFLLCERISTILVSHEAELRDSWTGRIVWRNWSLDLYKRARGDWVKKIKLVGSKAAYALQSLAPAATVGNPGDDGEAGEAKIKKVRAGRDSRKDRMKKIDEAPSKSPIELAREKFAAAKLGKGNPNQIKMKSRE